MSLCDVIDLVTPLAPGSGVKHVLVYLISGNPGLIEYYRLFFDCLLSILTKNNTDTMYHLHGSSLPGFELDHLAQQRTADSLGKAPPYSLNEIIDAVRTRVESKTASLGLELNLDTRSLPVILVGHSVGSYIILEIISRWQSKRPESAVHLIGGICLFPTVVDIAKSPSGRIAGPLALIPGFDVVVHMLSKLLLSWLSLAVVLPLVKAITRLPREAATITTAFLQSTYGVRQALYMAKDELRQIEEDDWSDELWGVQPGVGTDAIAADVSDVSQNPKLYFYWGVNDHWIANATRDAVIAARAKTEKHGDQNRPVMELDDVGTPHGFCTTNHYSEHVAKKVAGYVLQLSQQDTRR